MQLALRHTSFYFTSAVSVYSVYQIFNEICRRFLNFLRACISHKTPVVRSVVCYSMCHGRSNSPVGRNALFCPRRYG